MQDESVVAIFWDYENCHASASVSGYDLVGGIRRIAHRFGSIKLFKAYLELPEQGSSRFLSLRSELQSSGVSLTDCPHNGRKNVADQMIIVDMLAYAMDNPSSSTIVLISGDRDFAYALSVLRLRKYQVVLICPSFPTPHVSLRSQASTVINWTSDVINSVQDEPTLLSKDFTQLDIGSSSLSFPPLGSPTTTRTFASIPVQRPGSSEVMKYENLLSVSSPSVPCHTPQKSASDIEDLEAVPKYTLTAEASSAELHGENCNPSTSLIDKPLDVNNSSPPATESPAISNVSKSDTSPSATAAAPDYDDGGMTSSPDAALPPPEASSSPDPQNILHASSDAALPHAATVSAATAPVLPQPATESMTKVMPLRFAPLARILESYRQKGLSKCSRSQIAIELLKQDKKIYQKANASTFKTYSTSAEVAGIVTLGGKEGDAWISLHPDWHGKSF